MAALANSAAITTDRLPTIGRAYPGAGVNFDGLRAAAANATGMLVIVADTHRREGHGLSGALAGAVADAEVVVHAGDFTTEAVHAAFESVSERLVAVAGNNDEPALQRRLPDRAIAEFAGRRIAVVHGHDHDGTALGLLAREASADLVVVGHSHRPGVERQGPITVVNPGSHAEPRWHRPAYAVLERAEEGFDGRLVEVGGDIIGRFDAAGPIGGP